jgi:hypothetical protein
MAHGFHFYFAQTCLTAFRKNKVRPAKRNREVCMRPTRLIVRFFEFEIGHCPKWIDALVWKHGDQWALR